MSSVALGYSPSNGATTAKAQLPYHVSAYGATGDGTTDDTAAVQAAIDAATAAGGGMVYFPYGAYKLTSGLTVTKGITLEGEGVPGGNADGVDQSFARLLWYGTGACITYDGSHGASQGAGGGVVRLGIVQCASPGGTVSGTAIKLTGADIDHRVTWARIADVQMEQLSTALPWDIGIDIDGSLIGSNGVRDVWIDRVRVVSDATATAALRMQSAVNVFVANSHLNLSGDVIVTGTSTAPSSGIHIFGVNIDTLALDWVNDLELIGGQVATITNTANTGTASNPVVLLPGKFTNGSAYTNNAADHCGLLYYDYSSGTWVVERPLRLRNSQYLEGTKTNGTEVSMIGVTASDRISLDVGGLGVWAGTPQTQITSGAGKLRPQALTRSITSPTVNFSVVTSGDYYRASCTAGAVTATLPDATTCTGQQFTLKKIDASANALTIATTSAQTIDGAATVVLSTQWATRTVMSNGANWEVVASA